MKNKMKKKHKTQILVAAANELKKGARDNYRLTDLPVPKINSKDFNQTYVSPLGYFSLSLEGGKSTGNFQYLIKMMRSDGQM